MWQIWLIIAGVFFIAEMLTVGFLIFWLGIGALLAMIVSFFTSNLIIQTSVFVISSIILIFATKPLVNKFLGNKDIVPTNVYSIIGKKGIVTQDINVTAGTGQVKIKGEIWSALYDENISIPKDTEVTVVNVQGVKVFVEPIKSTINV